MNPLYKARRIVASVMAAWMTLQPLAVLAEDIDIYATTLGSAGAPNILLVLDNTSNWSRQSQQWPGGETQGQSEVDAIKTLINKIDFSTNPMNIGLMEFVTDGTANDNGGYVRSAIKSMGIAENKASLTGKLTTIYGNIETPSEKRNSGEAYGNLVYDIYNYFKGANQSQGGSGTPAALADAAGYASTYAQFKSPLACDNACAKNYVVFISNPNAQGPVADDAPKTPGNTDSLKAQNGDAKQILLPLFEEKAVTYSAANIGSTAGCYASTDAVKSAYGWGWSEADQTCRLYAATTTELFGQTGSVLMSDGSTLTCPKFDQTQPLKAGMPADLNTDTFCKKYTQGCTVGAQSLDGLPQYSAIKTTDYRTSAPAATQAGAGNLVGLTCPADALPGSCQFIVTPAATAPNNGTVKAETEACFATPPGSPSFVSGGKTAYLYPTGSPLNFTNTTGSAQTAASLIGNANLTNVITSPTSQCLTQGANGQCVLDCPAYNQCTYAWTATSSAGCPKTTGAGAQSSSRVGLEMTPTPMQQYNVQMTWVITAAAGSACPAGNFHYYVNGASKELKNLPTGMTFEDNTSLPAKGPHNIDEWARMMYQNGIPVSGCDAQKISFYTIDVYNKQPNAVHTSLMMSAGRNGGGGYFKAQSKDELVIALTKVFEEIQSVNTTFASASLPINATNRGQLKNEVYIGMFRPDAQRLPRWFGNLKRYQFKYAEDGVTVILADQNGSSASNTQTGFLNDCAVSYWTTESPVDPADTSKGYYWKDYPDIKPAPVSKCTGAISDVYSDLPDGPTVEKGAVAEAIRKGNGDAGLLWQVNRKFYTTTSPGGTGFAGPFTDLGSFTGLSSETQQWLQGKDRLNLGSGTGEDIDADYDEIRASVHGDVVHSRPVPVDYGSNVVIFYGANDGNLRAVHSESGKELWSFIPYDFAQSSFVDRLRSNSPAILYSNKTDPGAKPKEYGWDGSIGLIQDETVGVRIFPTLRRGGRFVYSLDVTNPEAPSMPWVVGCPKSGACQAGWDDIGQTWSAPNLAKVKGYEDGTKFLAFFGGGYDNCEDENAKNPACGAAKGRKAYVIDALSGEQKASFATERSVPADIALVDMNADNLPDYGYVADTGGNIYRIEMVKYLKAADGTITYTPLAPASWVMRKIGSTKAGEGRKFLFAPALFPVAKAGKVYVALGSGDREHPLLEQYPYGNVGNRFYVLLDDLGATDVVDLDALSNNTVDPQCDTSAQVTADSTKRGWYIDLVDSGGIGEQTVTSAVITGGVVNFSTNRPIPPNAGSCSTPLGEARGYAVNLLSGSGAIGTDANCGGSRSSIFVGGGLPPSPVVGTVLIGGKPTTVVIGAVQKEGGASTPISPQKVKPKVSPIRKRVYWRQQGVD